MRMVGQHKDVLPIDLGWIATRGLVISASVKSARCGTFWREIP